MTARIHGLDAARAFFLLLGIPFHYATISTFQSADVGTDFQQSIVVSVFMSISHSFRMFGFFFLAGYFSSMMIQKRGRIEWFEGRFHRVLVPFIVVFITIGTVNYQLNLFLFGQKSDFFDLPIALKHLWFPPVLMVFAGFLYFVKVERFANRRCVTLAASLSGICGAILLAGLAFWGVGRAGVIMFLRDHEAWDLIHLCGKVVQHLPPFLLGALVQLAPIRTSVFDRIATIHVVALISFTLTYVLLDSMARPAFGLPVDKTILERFISNLIELPLAFLWTLFLLVVMRHAVQRAHPIIDFFVRSAFSIYIIHLTVTMMIVSALAPLGLPVEFEWILGSLLIVGLSSLLYLAANQNRWLAYFYCGAPMRRQRPT